MMVHRRRCVNRLHFIYKDASNVPLQLNSSKLSEKTAMNRILAAVLVCASVCSAALHTSAAAGQEPGGQAPEKFFMDLIRNADGLPEEEVITRYYESESAKVLAEYEKYGRAGAIVFEAFADNFAKRFPSRIAERRPGYLKAVYSGPGPGGITTYVSWKLTALSLVDQIRGLNEEDLVVHGHERRGDCIAVDVSIKGGRKTIELVECPDGLRMRVETGTLESLMKMTERFKRAAALLGRFSMLLEKGMVSDENYGHTVESWAREYAIVMSATRSSGN